MEALLALTYGSTIVDSYCYSLVDNEWVITDPSEMEDILYTDKCFGVGCFVLEKD